jgi:hypothetical protein
MMNDKPNRKWRICGRVALIAATIPALYALSYFILGRHTTGENWVPRFTYHDRDFPFDPWIYIPLAKLECKLRGHELDVQVVIDGSPARDSSAMYMFWSREPKF